MIKLITEAYNEDNNILRIEYDTDKELEFINDIRKDIDDIIKTTNDKDLEWELAELKLNVFFDFTEDEIKNKVSKVKEKIKNNEKVKKIENLILALIEMKDNWKKLKEKFKEKFKVFDLGDILYVYM